MKLGLAHLFLGVALVLGITPLTPATVLAQDAGSDELVHEQAGPYEVVVLSDPPEPAAGFEATLTLRVAMQTGGSVPLGTSVTLALTNPRDGETQQQTLEKPQPNDPSAYETPFVPPNPGDWALRVTVTGPSGTASISTVLRVVTPATAATLPDELTRGIGGPYQIVVTGRPPSPLAGLGSRMSVRVLTVADGSAPADAEVRMIFTNPETLVVEELPLLQLPGNPEFFQSLSTFITSGEWVFTVVVEGRPGLGTLDGSMTVLSAGIGGGRGSLALWFSIMAVLIGGGFMFARAVRRQSRQQE